MVEVLNEFYSHCTERERERERERAFTLAHVRSLTQPWHENSSLVVCYIHLGGGAYHAAIHSCGNRKPASVVHVLCSSPQAHLDWDGATLKCLTLVHRNHLKIGWVMQYCLVSSLLGPNSRGENSNKSYISSELSRTEMSATFLGNHQHEYYTITLVH